MSIFSCARVSTRNQKDDLQNQVDFLRTFSNARGMIVDRCIEDFGSDWFEKFCLKFDTSILVVNNDTLSPNEELVEDIVSILHIFSCRLYGLRKYKNKIKADEEIAKELQDGNRSNTTAETDHK